MCRIQFLEPLNYHNPHLTPIILRKDCSGINLERKKYYIFRAPTPPKMHSPKIFCIVVVVVIFLLW